MGWVGLGIASLLSGAAAAMGLGGGMFLLIYLTALAGMPQLEAQWVNLLFFLPIGSLALVYHVKNKLIEKRAILPAVLAGLAGACLGVLLARSLGGGTLSKAFALFLGVIGLKELFHKG